MNGLVITLVILSAISAICSGRTLPEDVKKCSTKDPKLNECLLDRCNTMLRLVADGDRKQRIPSLKPFILNKLETVIDKMHLVLTNGKVQGFENSVVDSFELNKEDGTMEIYAHTPNLKLNSDYTTSGSLLILPIEGKGPFEMILKDLTFSVIITVDNWSKDSKDPVSVKSVKFDYAYGDGYFHFDKLFNGNKKLSDPINKLLSEEHQSINKEFKPTLLKAFDVLIASFVKPILDGYHYSELFVE